MDMRPEPFEPPAPIPRTVPPSRLEIIRTVLRNPLELWGEPSYTLPWIDTKFFSERTIIINDPGLIRHVLGKFREIVRLTMEKRKARMAANRAETPEDFLTLLLELAGPDGLTLDEIEDNILTFIGAGHETTARALGWTLYCVAHSPHIRAAMEEEIDRVTATGADPVEWLDLMPNVRAAFEEALRLYPPAPSINRAAIKDDSWTSPDGQTVRIAAGTTALVMPWTLHRHALYWDQPRAFMPERFLPENRSKINRFQYLPFGAGPRICIGATFAMQEAVIALAVLMGRYRFDVTPETKAWPVQKLTTQPRDGLPMRVRPRTA